MTSRILMLFLAATLYAVTAAAQPPETHPLTSPTWRPPGNVPAPDGSAAPIASTSASSTSAAGPSSRPASAADAASAGVLRTASLPEPASLTTVSKGTGTLPNDQGQVWREYDISSYTSRVTTTNRPEQAIVDWILRETGYEAWHSETVALLSADRRTLRVYHTPAMQQTVSSIINRFVNAQAESQAFGVQVMSLSSPDWRERAQALLHPVQVQTPGVQAWLLAKEDAATLLAQLGRRMDFRSYTSPHLIVNNGQPAIITLGQPHNYVRWPVQPDSRAGLQQPDVGQVSDGFSLELNPLLSLDGRTIDAIVKCNVDQLEKMIPVQLEVSSAVPGRQVTTIEVPQLSGTRLQERFRWPTDKVLLLSLGVVPIPMPAARGVLQWPFSNTSPRGDLLLLIDCKGNVPPAAGPISAALPSPAGSARYIR